MLRSFVYVQPRTLKEAIEHLSSPGARIHAGGTDLLGCLRDGVFEAKKLVSLTRVEEIRGIRENPDGGLRIGAMTIIAEVASSPVIRERYPGLAQAAREVGSPQLRNQGTLGGNLCQRPRCWYYRGDFDCARKGGSLCFAAAGENHYHCIFGGSICYIVHPSDTAPALIACGAAIRILGPRGERSLPLESFFILPEENVEKESVLEPDEILTEVVLPPAAAGWKSLYRKVRERGSWDFALTSVALAVQSSGGRVREARAVLGGVAPVPWRSRAIEEAVTGKRLDPGIARRAAEAAVRGAEPLDHNGYKISLVKGIVEESVLVM